MAETTTTTSAAARSTAAKAGATTRAKNATKRSTAAKKGAATRSRKTTASAAKSTQRSAKRTVKAETESAKSTAERVQDAAEKAVLVPVGAALLARDRAVEAAGELLDGYSSRTKVEREVKKYEKRGVKARTNAERQVRKTRTQIERELRTRRTRVERELTKARKDANAQLKLLDASVAPVRAQVELVQARAENFVQSGITAGTDAVARVSERVAAAA